MGVFDEVQNLSNGPAPSFFLTTGLSAPVSIGMAQSGQFWVADSSQNQLLHYPAVDQLPLKITQRTLCSLQFRPAPRSSIRSAICWSRMESTGYSTSRPASVW